MISHEIQITIDGLKKMPNSYEKNKVNSHLQDALVWAKELERKSVQAPHPADQCICLVGAVDEKCPVHGRG